MYWANFLHFYQPWGQQEDIMEAIVAQSYRPILNGVKRIKKSASLLTLTAAFWNFLINMGIEILLIY